MTDHVRGDGPVELTEFGDFECPFCRDAAPSLRRVQQRLDGRVRLRWRHFPIAAKHPHALRAAAAAEAAGAQGKFWEMHDLLFSHQKALEDEDLAGYARELGLDVDRFVADLNAPETAAVVEKDRELGLSEGVAGTPSFLINGRPYGGFYDVETLVDELEDAGA